MKKKIYALLTAFALGLATFDYAIAADPIQIYVTTVPGGAIDMTARSLSKALTASGYDNVVMYQPGAHGDIALGKTLEKPNNSILVAGASSWVFSHVALNRDNIHVQDLQLVGPSVSNAMAFYAPQNKDIKTLKDLIARARQSDLPCAVSNSHGEIELKQLNKQYGTKFTPVPYKGTGQLIPDVIGGHVQCAYDQIAPYAQLQEKVIFLGTSGATPYKQNIPVISSVLPGYTYASWYAMGIPKNSPLLDDKKFLEIARHWNQNKDLVGPLVEKSFVVEKFDPDLNIRAVKETAHYRNLLK